MSGMPTAAAKSSPFSGWRDWLAQEHVLPALVRDPRRADTALHRAVPRPAERLPRHVRVDIGVNTAVPTVLVAVGQTIVVITRGIDLSVGGVIDVSNALAATHMKDSLASMIGWSLAILASARPSVPPTGSSPTADSSRSLSPWQRSRSCRGLRSGSSRSRAVPSHPPTRTRSQARKDRGASSSSHSWQSPGWYCGA
jgi:Ribose/xylose/arabinose/galactoside ABC-type transport systems, permease components